MSNGQKTLNLGKLNQRINNTELTSSGRILNTSKLKSVFEDAKKAEYEATVESNHGIISWYVDDTTTSVWLAEVPYLEYWGVPGLLYRGAKALINTTRSTKEIKETRKQDVVKFAKDVYENNQSSVGYVLGEGTVRGLKQNVSLLTGAEFPDKALGNHPITKAELEEYTKSGDMPKAHSDAATEFVENRELAVDITSAVTNSFLIMGELYFTGGASVSSLTTQGIKFASKEGLKLWGKEALKAGVQSWKLMGTGANIRAIDETAKEIKELSKTEKLDLWDYARVYTKNASIENIEAGMEGLSEKLIKDFKLGSVGWKNLLQGEKGAWKTLSKNIGKHAISSTLFETGTEQVTDIVSDVLRKDSHASVFNLLSSQPEHRKEALNNLIIEMATGFILGNAIGVGKVFTEKPIQAMIDAGVPVKTVEEIIKVVTEPTVLKAMTEEIIKANDKKEENKEKKQTGKDALTLLDAGAGKISLTEALKDPGKKNVEREKPIIKKKKAEAFEATTKGPERTVIEDLLYTGKFNIESYFRGIGSTDPNIKITPGVLARDVLSKATPETLSKYTKLAEGAVLNIGADLKVQAKLNLPTGIPEQLYNDITTTYILGLNSTEQTENLKEKWAWGVDPKVLDNVLDILGKTTEKAMTGKETLQETLAMVNSGRAAFMKAMGELAVAVRKQPQEDIVEEPNPTDVVGEDSDPDLFFRQSDDLTEPHNQAFRQEPDAESREEIIDTYLIGDEKYEGLRKELKAAQKTEVTEEVTQEVIDANVQATKEKIDKLKAEWWTENKEKVLYQKDAPQTAGKYGDIIRLNERTSLSEMIKRLSETGMQNENLVKVGEILGIMMPELEIIGMPTAQKSGTINRGSYDPVTHTVSLNPNIPFTNTNGEIDNGALHNTLVHEAIHAWTVKFMNSGSKAAIVFKGKVRGVINQVNLALREPNRRVYPGSKLTRLTMSENLLKKRMKSASWMDIQDALKSPEELIAALYSDTENLKGLLSHVIVGGAKSEHQSVWRELLDYVINAIKKHYEAISKSAGKIPSENAFEAVTSLVESYTGSILRFNSKNRYGARLGSTDAIKDIYLKASNIENVRKDVTDAMEDKYDALDLLQETEGTENQLEHIVLKGFIESIAELKGISTTEYFDWLKGTTRNGMLQEIARLDAQNGGILTQKLKDIHEVYYKRKSPDFEQFKRRYLTQKRNRALGLKLKKFISIKSITPQQAQDETGATILPAGSVETLPHNFKASDGKKKNTYREDTVFEQYTAGLISKLGLPANSISVAYVNDITTITNGVITDVSNIQRLRGKTVGGQTGQSTSQAFATHLWRSPDSASGNRYLYLGNFGGKNTMPVLEIKKQHVDKVMRKFKDLGIAYEGAMANSFTTPSIKKNLPRASYGARAFMEDMWFNSGVSLNKQGVLENSYIQDESAKKKFDWNKMQKRGVKWTFSRTVAEQSPDFVKEFLPDLNTYTGITYENGKIKAKAIVFNSQDKGMLDLIDINGEALQIPIETLLRNELGTEITDGATFFILGEFDKVYGEIHGTLKDGAIKNIYGSDLTEKDPLFIKHAMHGISSETFLGKWMQKNGIALLVSDQAAKIVPQVEVQEEGTGLVEGEKKLVNKIADISNPDVNQQFVYDLDIDKFARIKEEQNTSPDGGSAKQPFNGSGFGAGYNVAIKNAAGDIDLDGVMNDLMENIVDVMEIGVKDVGAEEHFAELKDMIMNPTSPKEDMVAKSLAPFMNSIEDGNLAQIQGFFNNPMVAEMLRNRLKSKVYKALETKLPGWRAALRPNLGYASFDSDIKPIINNPNIRRLVMADSKALNALVPNKDLRDLLKKFYTAQRERGYTNKRTHPDKLAELVEEIKSLREQIAEMVPVDEESSKTAQKKYKARVLKNPLDIINMSSEEGLKHKKRIINSILDKKTGRLKSGYAIISAQDARSHNVRPGEEIIGVVTPTDSMLSVSAPIVAGIMSEGVADNNTIIMNSEYIQTMVGKDFDIDTISMIPFSPTLWTSQNYNSIVEVLKNTEDAYKAEMVKSMKRVFKRGNFKPKINGETVEINEKTIFDPFLKQQYNMIMQGPTEGRNTFAMTGKDFYYINDAYVVDPSTVIVQRLLHTALSAIDFKVKDFSYAPISFGKRAKEVRIGQDLEVRNKNWFDLHNLHINMTTDVIDFPNNTTKLTYLSDPSSAEYKKSMFGHTYGLAKDTMDNLDDQVVDAMKTIHRALFQGAFDLTKQSDGMFRELQEREIGVQGSLTYPELVDMIKIQQRIFQAIESKDDDYLINKLIWPMMDNKHAKTTAHLRGKGLDWANDKHQTRKAIAAAVVSRMEIGDLNEFPLFKMIKELDPMDYPVPGNTYVDHLAYESMAVEQLVAMYPNLQEILDRGIIAEAKTAKAQFFTPKEGAFPNFSLYDGESTRNVNIDKKAEAFSLLTRENDSVLSKRMKQGQRPTDEELDKMLDILKREIISITHAIDQPSTPETIGLEQQLNDIGRSRTFPTLLQLALSNSRILFKDDAPGEIQLKQKGKVALIMGVSVDGGVGIKLPGGKAYTHRKIMGTAYADSEEMKQIQQIRALLFESDGLMRSADNRAQINRLFTFQKNTNIDDRVLIAKRTLEERLYGKDFTSEEQAAFWLSSIAAATNVGLENNIRKNFIINNSLWTPAKPNKFAYNGLIFTLLADYEPGLLKTFVEAYSHISETYDKIPMEKAVKMLSKDTATVEQFYPQAYYTDSGPGTMYSLFHERLSGLENKTFKTKEFRHFSKLVDEQGVAAGLNAFKQLVRQSGTLQALSELEVNVEAFVGDLAVMNEASFNKKYAHLDTSTMAQTIANHDRYTKEYALRKEGEVDARVNLKAQNSTELGARTLKALYYTVLDVRNKDLKVRAKKSKLLPFLNFETGILPNEKKTLAYTNDDAIIGKVITRKDADPNGITVRDVKSSIKLYVTKTETPIGEASRSFAIQSKTDQALNFRQTEMHNQVGAVDELIERVINPEERESYLAENQRRYKDIPEIKFLYENLEKINKEDRNAKNKDKGRLLEEDVFNTAEDLGNTFWDTKVGTVDSMHVEMVLVKKGPIEKYEKKFTLKINKEQIWYNSAEDMINAAFAKTPAKFKLTLFSALKLREIYDIQVPSLINAALEQINHILSEVSTSTAPEAIAQLKALAARYEDYKDAIVKNRYSYMPHQFPTHIFKDLWKQAHHNEIRLEILAAVQVEQKQKDRGATNYTRELGDIVFGTKEGETAISKLVLEALEADFDKHQINLADTYMISNMRQRKMVEDDNTYNKNMDTNYHYMNTLFSGVKNDVMYASWLDYSVRAKNVGENPGVVQSMKMWYANQMRNKIMHGTNVKFENVKPGMQVSFYTQGAVRHADGIFSREEGILVSGTVKKSSAGILHLKVNAREIINKAKKEIQRRNDVAYDRMAMDGMQGSLSTHDMTGILNLIYQGYIDGMGTDEISQLTAAEANDLIIGALENVISNPNLMGEYSTSQLYNLDSSGNRTAGVHRYMRRGAKEYLKGKTREFNNLRSIEGTFGDAMTSAQYNVLKAATNVSEFVSNAHRKIAALMFMGLAASPKATVTNYAGAWLSNLTDSPLTNWRNLRRAKKTLESIRKGDEFAMSDDDKHIRDLFKSLGLLEDNMLAISLESANIDSDEMLTSKKWRDIVKWAADTWRDSAGYKQHVEELQKAQEQVYIAPTSQARLKAEAKVKRIKDVWALKAQGYLEEAAEYTEEEVMKALAEMVKHGKTKVDMAAEQGLTRGMLTKVALRLIRKKAYVSKFGGIGLQATAEKLRMPAFMLGYYAAKDANLSEAEAIQYGINQVELKHAFYGSAYKQFGAQTSLGRTLFQFSQYAFNSFAKTNRLIKEGVTQMIEHMPRGKGSLTPRIEKTDSRGFLATVMPKRIVIPKIKYLLSRNIIEWDNVAQDWVKDKGPRDIESINVLSALLYKHMIGYVMMQVGSRVLYGVTNFQDPMVQLAYGIMDSITDLGSDRSDDEEKEDLLWLLGDLLFFVGVPYKLFTQLIFSDEKDDLKDIYVRGRVSQQDQFFTRIYNTLHYFHLTAKGRPAPRKMKTIWEPTYLIDDLALGIKLTGWTGASKHRVKVHTASTIFGDNVVGIPTSRRPIDTKGKGVDWKRRAYEMFNPKTYIPFLDKLTEK